MGIEVLQCVEGATQIFARSSDVLVDKISDNGSEKILKPGLPTGEVFAVEVQCRAGLIIIDCGISVNDVLKRVPHAKRQFADREELLVEVRDG
jgi:hypothetical protein